MQQICTREDIKKLGTILSVWAHPDDESFTCAGIMKVAIDGGQVVACITATKGELGVQDEARWPANLLADIRAREMAETLAIIGVKNHHWLGYADGHCHDVDSAEASQRIYEYIQIYQPDTILTFGPDGMTGHSDHQSISNWVSLSVAELQDKDKPVIYHAVQLKQIHEQYLKAADKQFNIYFNIDQPPLVESTECAICFHLPEAVSRTKCAALAAQHSQTEGLLKVFGEENLPKVFSYETFVLA